MKENTTDRCSYEDIIHLPHHVSSSHPQMELLARAVQFAPFQALTGYEGAIREEARLTDEKIELDENAKAILDEKLQILRKILPEKPTIDITYFQPDESKSGGAYVAASGKVKKIDEFSRSVIMADGLQIPFESVFDIQGVTPYEIRGEV